MPAVEPRLCTSLLGVALVLFNSKAVAGWTPEVRKVVHGALAEATIAQREYAEQDDEICTSALIADGVTFVSLSPQEREAFTQTTRDEVLKTRKRFSPELIAMFDEDLAKAPP